MVGRGRRWVIAGLCVATIFVQLTGFYWIFLNRVKLHSMVAVEVGREMEGMAADGLIVIVDEDETWRVVAMAAQAATRPLTQGDRGIMLSQALTLVFSFVLMVLVLIPAFKKRPQLEA